MRRAEWRRRADDPTTLLGWWWRGIIEENWPLHAAAGLVVPFAIMLAKPWVAGAGMALFILANGVRAFRLRDRLAPLLPDPAPDGQFRATAVYRRQVITTGEDPMALTVVDGWLVGEGLRSRFALRPQDVRELRFGSVWKTQLTLVDGGEIRLLGVLDPGKETLERWHSLRASPEGAPTFPPRFVHPAPFARWAAWTVAGFLVGSVPNLAKMLFHFPQLLSVPFLAVGVGMIFVGGRRFFRLVDVMVAARKEAVARLPEGTSILVDVLGSRIEIKGASAGTPSQEERVVT